MGAFVETLFDKRLGLARDSLDSHLERQGVLRMHIGFARASRCGPSLADQRAELLAAGCAEVVEIGPRASVGDALDDTLSRLGQGDVLVVPALDRLPGSLRDATHAASRLIEAGASLRLLSPALELGTAEALSVLEAAAAFERDRRAEKQAAGIDARRAAGGYTKGRPKAADPREVKAALDAGEGATVVARRLGIGRSTVYRLAEEARAGQ